MKIPITTYLAGGMHPKKVGDRLVSWQDEVMKAIPPSRTIHHTEPRRNKADSSREELLPHDGWASLDLWMAAQADAMFCHLEADNPGGEGSIGEVYLNRGANPFGIRVVVNEDSLEDKRGEMRNIETEKGVFKDAWVPNRARYRRFVNFAGRPYLPHEMPGKEPYVPYRTLDEGIAFFTRALQQFAIPDDHEPVFLSLIGNPEAAPSEPWFPFAEIQHAFEGDCRVLHFLYPDACNATENQVEYRTLQDFFSWKADAVVAYAPQGGAFADYAEFFRGTASAKAMCPSKIVVAVCPDKDVLALLGDHNCTFDNLENALGFLRIWEKQFNERVAK